jgi:ubiquitin carboxyl-terminal hydrolase 34
MNLAQQMDASEFFNVFFDKLENALKGTPQEKLLEHVFGGVISNQLTCITPTPHTAERLEKFFILSLEVKNKSTLAQALDLYVEGEKLQGDNKYHCASCKVCLTLSSSAFASNTSHTSVYHVCVLQKKVDTLKRCCLRDLPRNLICHLKRFEFDVETLSKKKLNDALEFPTVLDLEPYTVEGLERKARAAAAAAPAAGVSAPTADNGQKDEKGICFMFVFPCTPRC